MQRQDIFAEIWAERGASPGQIEQLRAADFLRQQKKQGPESEAEWEATVVGILGGPPRGRS